MSDPLPTVAQQLRVFSNDAAVRLGLEHPVNLEWAETDMQGLPVQSEARMRSGVHKLWLDPILTNAPIGVQQANIALGIAQLRMAETDAQKEQDDIPKNIATRTVTGAAVGALGVFLYQAFVGEWAAAAHASARDIAGLFKDTPSKTNASFIEKSNDRASKITSYTLSRRQFFGAAAVGATTGGVTAYALTNKEVPIKDEPSQQVAEQTSQLLSLALLVHENKTDYQELAWQSAKRGLQGEDAVHAINRLQSNLMIIERAEPVQLVEKAKVRSASSSL